jgi:hypothetical protein
MMLQLHLVVRMLLLLLLVLIMLVGSRTTVTYKRMFEFCVLIYR